MSTKRQSMRSMKILEVFQEAHDKEVLRTFAEEVNAFLRANDRECMEMPECIMQRPSPLQRTPSELDERTRGSKRRKRGSSYATGAGKLSQGRLRSKERNTHDFHVSSVVDG